jgi:hypothetical protein
MTERTWCMPLFSHLCDPRPVTTLPPQVSHPPNPRFLRPLDLGRSPENIPALHTQTRQRRVLPLQRQADLNSKGHNWRASCNDARDDDARREQSQSRRKHCLGELLPADAIRVPQFSDFR